MPEYRRLEAELKILEKTGPFLFPVEIALVNDRVNRNGWQFINLPENKNKFAGTPLLVAYVNGGRTIGDGHNFRPETDPETGEPAPSFTDATAERIVGALSEDENDIRVEDRNGTQWIVGKGYLWAFYAKELVAQIVNYAEQGRTMSVSIEALVSKNRVENGVEIEEEYEILGTTLLGNGVEPAVEGAHIAMLSKADDGFKKLKIKAASYLGNGSEDRKTEKPKKKGMKGHMRLSKQQLRELQAKFGTSYTVLAAVQTEENGVVVCLMDKAGKTAMYTMASLDEAIVLEKRVQEVNAQVHFCADGCEDILVDACDMVENLSADVTGLTERLSAAEGELTECRTTISAMRDAENRRRVGAAREMANSTLFEFNASREEPVDEKVLSAVNADIDSGVYTASVDKDGNWIGDKAVRERVLAICAEAVMEADKKAAKARQSAYVWDGLHKGDADDGSIEALLSRKLG